MAPQPIPSATVSFDDCRSAPPAGWRQGGFAHPHPCWWTEPSTASLCPFGKDIDAHTHLPMGTWTAPFARPLVAAGSPLRTDYARSTCHATHNGGQRRCLHPSHSAATTYTRCRRGVLRSMAPCRDSEKPWCLRLVETEAVRDGIYAAKAVGSHAGRTVEDPSLPHRHRHLATQRSCRRGAHQEVSATAERQQAAYVCTPELLHS